MQYVGRFVSSVYNTITPNINPATLSGAIDVIVVERQVEVDCDSDEDEDGNKLPSNDAATAGSSAAGASSSAASRSMSLRSPLRHASSASSVSSSLCTLGQPQKRKRKKVVTEMASTPFHVRFGKMSVLRPAERKVTLHLNSSPDPLPFAMKVGEAGEAFFVFEVDPDTAPPDLVTSPVLSATTSPVTGPTTDGQRPERSNTADVEALDLGEPAVRADGSGKAPGSISTADSVSGASASESGHGHAGTGVTTPEDAGSEAGTARSPSPEPKPTREQLQKNKHPQPGDEGAPGDLPLPSDSGATGSGPHAGTGSILDSVGDAASRAGGALRSMVKGTVGVSASDKLPTDGDDDKGSGEDAGNKGEGAPSADQLDGGRGRGEGTDHQQSESKNQLQRDDDANPPEHGQADKENETELERLEREMRDQAELLLKAEMEATRLTDQPLEGEQNEEGGSRQTETEEAYPAPFGEGTKHNLRPDTTQDISASTQEGASAGDAGTSPTAQPASSSASTMSSTYPVAQSVHSAFLDGKRVDSMAPAQRIKDISAARKAEVEAIRADLEDKKKRYEDLKAQKGKEGGDKGLRPGADPQRFRKLPASDMRENASYMFDMDGYKMTADGEDLAFAEGQRLANELPLSRRHGGKGRQGHSERLDHPHRHPRYLKESIEGERSGSALPNKPSSESLDSRRSASSSGSDLGRAIRRKRQGRALDDDVLSTDSEDNGASALDVANDPSVDSNARQFSRDLVRLARMNEGKAVQDVTSKDLGLLQPPANEEATENVITSDEDALPEGVPRTRRASSSHSDRPRSYSRGGRAGRRSHSRMGHVAEASISDSETPYNTSASRVRSSSAAKARVTKPRAGTIRAEPEALPPRAQSPDYDWNWGEMPKRREATTDGVPPRVRATSMEAMLPDSPQPDPAGRLSHKEGDPYLFVLDLGDTIHHFQLSLCWREGFGEDPDADEYNFEENRVSYGRFMEDADLINDVRLVIKYNGTLPTWENASTVMATLSLYRQSLPAKQDSAGPPGQAGAGAAQASRWRRWWNRGNTSAVSGGNGGVAGIERSSTDTDLLLDKQRPAVKTEQSAAAPQSNKVYAKTLRLTSDQLKSLNLKKGANTITFSVTSSYSGVATCTARIFLWEASHQIVVSDIDGTITKSDALGHVFTMIGRDWTHLGVAKLYTDIARNGYRIMYLTSRAIGQADTTRDYLRGIKQDNYQLPDGPVIMSPDRLYASLHREVILRKPEVFKMACLRDIARLFGSDPRASQAAVEDMKKADSSLQAAVKNDVKAPAAGAATAGGHAPTPFYAGFGNRITDALSYRSVNIPSSRIFTIDTNGEVKMELLEMAGYKSSYIHMTDLVDQMFPPITVREELNPRQREYSDFNYWRPPIEDVELPPDEELMPTNPVSPALSARSGRSIRSARSNGSVRSVSLRSDNSGEVAAAAAAAATAAPASSRLSRFGLPSLGLGRRSSGNNMAAANAEGKTSAAAAAEAQRQPQQQRAATVPPESTAGTSPPSSYGNGVTSWASSWRRRAASPGATSQTSLQATSPLVGPVITAAPDSEDEDDRGGSDDDVSSLEGDDDRGGDDGEEGQDGSGSEGSDGERPLSEDDGGSYDENMGDDVLADDLLEQGEIRFEWRG